MQFTELKCDLATDTTPVKDWEHIPIGKWGNTRIYIKPLEDGMIFYVIDFYSCGVGDDIWKMDDLEVSILMKGFGYFDGIRHMYVGEEGYVYYPEVQKLTEIFTKLRELEKKYCWDAEEDGSY